MNEELNRRDDQEVDVQAIKNRIGVLKCHYRRIQKIADECLVEMKRRRLELMILETGVCAGDRIVIEGRPGRLLYYEAHPWVCVPIGAYDRKDGKPGKREIRLSFLNWSKAPEQIQKEVHHG